MKALIEACERFSSIRQERLAIYDANDHDVLCKSEYYKSLCEQEDVWCEAINRMVRPSLKEKDFVYITGAEVMTAKVVCNTLELVK